MSNLLHSFLLHWVVHFLCSAPPLPFAAFRSGWLLGHFLHRLHASTVGGARWGGFIGGWPWRGGINAYLTINLATSLSMYVCTCACVYLSIHPSICLTTTCIANPLKFQSFFPQTNQFTIVLILWSPTHTLRLWPLRWLLEAFWSHRNQQEMWSLWWYLIVVK